MARTLTTPLQVARQVIASNKAWLFFVAIAIKSPPGPANSFFRFVANPKHVRANGKLWQAASITVELPAEELDGSLGSLKIEVPNVSRLPIAYVEADDYLLGQDLTVYLQHETSLTTFELSLSWRHTILRCAATERKLTIECGHPADVLQVPMGVYDRLAYPGLLPSAGGSLAAG